MEPNRMAIILADSAGNRRCIIVERRQTLAEFMRNNVGGQTMLVGGDQIYGPEHYNQSFEKLNIKPGSDLEVVQPFRGGNLLFALVR
jgi:hypothetical protein